MSRTTAKPKPYRFTLQSRSQREQDYVSELAECLKSSPFSAVEQMMNFPLYAPRQNVTNFLIKYEIFKRILEVHGSIVECGVFFGAGLLGWSRFSAILEPVNHTRKIIGFDTFRGFPRLSKKDGGAESEQAHPSGLAINCMSISSVASKYTT